MRSRILSMMFPVQKTWEYNTHPHTWIYIHEFLHNTRAVSVYVGSHTDSSFPSQQSWASTGTPLSPPPLLDGATVHCRLTDCACVTESGRVYRLSVPQPSWGSLYRFSCGVWKPPSRGGFGCAGVQTKEYHSTSSR